MEDEQTKLQIKLTSIREWADQQLTKVVNAKDRERLAAIRSHARRILHKLLERPSARELRKLRERTDKLEEIVFLYVQRDLGKRRM